jgi:hypothetical protein
LDVIYEALDDDDEDLENSPSDAGGQNDTDFMSYNIVSSPMRRNKTFASLFEPQELSTCSASKPPLGMITSENGNEDEWGFYDVSLSSDC